MSALVKREQRFAWGFLAPTLLALCLVAVWPLMRSLYFSITNATLDNLDSPRFVWLNNYLTILRDGHWWRAVGNTLHFTIVSVGCETVLGLALAILLQTAMRGRGLLRAAILVPWSIPVVVSAQMWGWMLHDQFGVFNLMLVHTGIIHTGIAWTATPQLVIWSIIFIDVWITTPFMVLLILAGLQMIPAELHEAAVVDGVPAWKRFWSITLPMLSPALGVAILFRTLDALRMFDLSYVLGGNAEQTMTMSIYARNRLIAYQELGMGAAASTCVFLIVGIIAVAIIAMLRLDRQAGGQR